MNNEKIEQIEQIEQSYPPGILFILHHDWRVSELHVLIGYYVKINDKLRNASFQMLTISNGIVCDLKVEDVLINVHVI